MTKSKVNCICCNRELEVELVDDNPLTISPIYDGLIFRAIGNFGSTVFDPMPTGIEEMLQVIICDDCIRTRAKRVTRLCDIQRNVIAEAWPFDFDDG